MLLNVPPDNRGLIHENDVKRLMEFRTERDRIFKTDLARGRKGASVTFTSSTVIDHIVLRENIALGQRVKRFRMVGELEGKATELAKGTTIGNRRILKISPTRVKSVTLIIEDTRATPALLLIEIYGR